ncbi:hypothetical protein AB6A40_000767 [Gnathostoma spinigerum]|uniref:17S U2 SnRNP complex component HTATSF1 n=1 Tax=Gnathostoma spinigerum TaxID=75299 RepID=A0ABD6E2U5_9BILA
MDEASAVENTKSDVGQTLSEDTSQPERRFIDGVWLCKDDEGGFLKYDGQSWIKADGDDLNTKWEAAANGKNSSRQCVVDGVTMEWNDDIKQWIPVSEVDEDFLARYHLNYGVQYNFDAMKERAKDEKSTSDESTKGSPPEKQKDKRHRNEEQGWVELDESKNSAVYVSNLPTTFTIEEFTELMSKCGVIKRDPRNNKLKIKLYTDSEGNLKGDGSCTYVKTESVNLALDILDGWKVKGKEIRVQKAKFEMKGEFDPKKKRKKLTAAQKKRYIENQQRIFEWKPEKPRNYRPICECTVVLKNMFTLDQMMKNSALLLDLEEEVRKTSERFGKVKKIVVHDNNPDGVVCVTFDNVEGSDTMIRSLNGRVVDGRKITAELWDGKTKYTIIETEEQREQRMAQWRKFIEDEEDSAK